MFDTPVKEHKIMFPSAFFFRFKEKRDLITVKMMDRTWIFIL